MSTSPSEDAALGISLEIPSDLTNEKVWQALLIKIESPQKILPVTDVIHRVSDDGLGTYREMTVPGPKGPIRVLENIYSDKSIWEVNFKSLTSDTEIVNLISTDPTTSVRSLEFFLRDSSTKERAYWHGPKAMGLAGIEKTFDVARSLE
jgi:hypothetical protein